MSQRFQHAIAELQQLLPKLNLHLPASPSLIKRQITHISLTQQQLEQMVQTTQTTLKTTHNRSLRQRYSTLMCIIQQLSREADNLTILAEEFSTDPEGAIGCLQSINQRREALVKQMEQLR